VPLAWVPRCWWVSVMGADLRPRACWWSWARTSSWGRWWSRRAVPGLGRPGRWGRSPV